MKLFSQIVTEVYKKPLAKKFTSQSAGEHPCSNHDDQLEVLHLALDVNRCGILTWANAALFRPALDQPPRNRSRSVWRLRNAEMHVVHLLSAEC